MCNKYIEKMFLFLYTTPVSNTDTSFKVTNDQLITELLTFFAALLLL